LNFSKNDSKNRSFLCTVRLGNEWFFRDKAGSENRSLECPVLLKPRQNHTIAWDSVASFLNRQLAKNDSFGEWTIFEHKYGSWNLSFQWTVLNELRIRFCWNRGPVARSVIRRTHTHARGSDWPSSTQTTISWWVGTHQQQQQEHSATELVIVDPIEAAVR
jgi:hypothetical protein